MDVLGRMRFAARAGGFAAWTSGVVFTNQVVARFDDDHGTHWGKSRFIHAWSVGVVPLFGLDLHVQGARPTGLGPYLVVANHRSPLDIFVAIHLVGGVVLSHHGVADMPVIGYAARATDTIFVDRQDSKSGARAIRQMRSRLKEGRNVIAFPEGTTFDGDEVRPFKRGSFTAAKGLDAKVLPLGIAYERGSEYVNETFGNHMVRMTSRPTTRIWAAIGEPIDVPRNPGEEEDIRQVVQGLVDRAAAVRDQ